MTNKLVPTGGNDVVYTPMELALQVVDHFNVPKSSLILEPCKGDGVFIRALRDRKYRKIKWCEIALGRNFFEFNDKVDWIITNPPWSLMRQFMEHSYKVSDNQIWLVTINHVIALKRRLKDMREAGFGVREILLVDTPPAPWPQSGFQLGACHVQRGWTGDIKFTY